MKSLITQTLITCCAIGYHGNYGRSTVQVLYAQRIFPYSLSSVDVVSVETHVSDKNQSV